jgi:hypothetical protein
MNPPMCGCTYTPGSTVTVTNVGGAPLDIGTITLKYGTDGFSQTNSCVATLDTGQSCDIDVGFNSPAQFFTFSDDVIVTDNATDSPQSVSLSGRATCLIP